MRNVKYQGHTGDKESARRRRQRRRALRRSQEAELAGQNERWSQTSWVYPPPPLKWYQRLWGLVLRLLG